MAVAELRIISQKEGVENMSRRIQHIFYNKENDWGYSYYISWNVSGFINIRLLIIDYN